MNDDPRLVETELIVYRWEDEAMKFVRRIFIRRPIGEQITAEGVRMELALGDDHLDALTRGRYRVIPADAWTDIVIKSTVEIA